MRLEETTVGDLSTNHIGCKVTVITPDAIITGMLRGIQSETEWINECSPGKKPGIEDEVPGLRTTTISVGRWHMEEMPLDAPVVLEGPE